MRGRIH